MKPPPIQWAESPEGKIAYQVLGDGPIDLLFVPQWGGYNLDVQWEHPPIERYFRRLASFSRLILFNFRGIGVSDPIPLGAPPPAEEWATDVRWILDAAGSERAALLIIDTPGFGSLFFPATYPERTAAVALVNSAARIRRSDDYPWGLPSGAMERMFDWVIRAWGTGEVLQAYAPDLAGDERFREWFARLERLTANPTSMEIAFRSTMDMDVRGILGAVKCPTLVISHASHPYIRPGHGEYLAEHIPNARYVERPGFFGLYWAHDVDWVLDEVQTFFTGTKGAPSLDDRVLATVLFTDIVGSTQRAAELGDERWRMLLDEHDRVTRQEIERFRGRAVNSTGDGFLATFDGPARAIRCAAALSEAMRSLGIEVRTGLHTGEVEQREDNVGGIAVHIAARVMKEAGPSEVLVSGAVPPLVAGSGIEFDDRGAHVLKGVPGEWRLYTVKS